MIRVIQKLYINVMYHTNASRKKKCDSDSNEPLITFLVPSALALVPRDKFVSA
jgi:hypothetical protein